MLIGTIGPLIPADFEPLYKAAYALQPNRQ